MKNTADDGLANGRLWLARARQDFAAFKRLVPLTRNNYRAVRVSDAALAVYLLQQTHEKAAKAIALASGKYGQEGVKSRFGHRSPTALLQHFTDQLAALSDFGAEPLLGLFGASGAARTQKLEQVQSQLPGWKSELARLNSESVLRLLDFLCNGREAMLESLKSAWGPHSSLTYVPSDATRAGSAAGLLADVEQFWTQSLGQPKLPDDQVGVLRDFLESLGAERLLNVAETGSGRVTVRRNTEALLYSWAVYALFVLSALTWPHEATARYPRWQPRGNRSVSSQPLGAQDYNEAIGVVAHLGYAGYLTGLALQDCDTAMENAAVLCNVAVVKDA